MSDTDRQVSPDEQNDSLLDREIEAVKAGSIDPYLPRDMLKKQVDNALDALPAEDADLISRAFGLDTGVFQSTAEIAAELGLSEEEVDNRIGHALRQLRELDSASDS